MIKNYLKIAFRYFLKHKGYSFINIMGLAVGIASALLIFLYVQNEMSYDSFHKDSNRIYLIHTKNQATNGDVISARSPNPLPKVLRNDYTELVGVVSFFGTELPVTVNNTTFEEKCFTTESNFFEMFDFKLLIGNPETALGNPNSVVLTKRIADKYFGEENPVGKTIKILNNDFQVTGILEKLPENTGIQFGLLLSDKIREIIIPGFDKQWHSFGVITYVQVSEKFTAKELENQLPYLAQKYLNEYQISRTEFGVQPMTSMHLNSDLEDQMVQPNSLNYLIILLLIAFAVLLIACINFMNLSTARYSERIKEIGVRKVLGANRKELIKQFIGESILLSFLALIIGIVLAEAFLPKFNEFTGKELEFAYYKNFISVLGLLLFGLIIGVFSGSYPALFLSRYNPTNILYGKVKTSKTGIDLRTALVVIQFSITILLIITELFITKQLSFMKNHDLGFNPDNVLVIPINQLPYQERMVKANVFISDINSNKEKFGFTSTAISEHVPGYYYNNKFGVIPESWNKDNSVEMIVTSIDDKFLATYGIDLSKGRTFSTEYGTDNECVLINETGNKKIGWKNPLDKHLSFVHGEGPYKIIGVIKDIHFRSLQHNIEPLVIRYIKGMNWNKNFISIKLANYSAGEALNFLQSKWQEITQEYPFEYFFLEDKYKASYGEEEKTVDIIGVSSFLAVFLACMGLFGLAALSTTQRTKEIGIRKVLGASISGIITLLSKQFILIVLIANLVACPFAYYAVVNWLQDYPYHIDIGIELFLLGGLATVCIAFMAVVSQALKAALANPVESLKYE